MRKIMYYRALFILTKNVAPLHFHDVIEKEVFESHSKGNSFSDFKMLNILIIVLFTRKLKLSRHFELLSRYFVIFDIQNKRLPGVYTLP